jgi:hypothetical protein
MECCDICSLKFTHYICLTILILPVNKSLNNQVSNIRAIIVFSFFQYWNNKHVPGKYLSILMVNNFPLFPLCVQKFFYSVWLHSVAFSEKISGKVKEKCV